MIGTKSIFVFLIGYCFSDYWSTRRRRRRWRRRRRLKNENFKRTFLFCFREMIKGKKQVHLNFIKIIFVLKMSLTLWLDATSFHAQRHHHLFRKPRLKLKLKLKYLTWLVFFNRKSAKIEKSTKSLIATKITLSKDKMMKQFWDWTEPSCSWHNTDTTGVAKKPMLLLLLQRRCCCCCCRRQRARVASRRHRRRRRRALASKRVSGEKVGKCWGRF